MPKSLFVLAAVALGGFVALQLGLNAEVARRLGSPFGASFVSIAVSFILASVFMLGTRQGVAVGGVVGMPWHLWLAGVIGFAFVIAALALAPVLGASLLFAAVIAGQMIVAVVLDMTGFGGYQGHGFDPWRIAGIALVLGGVWAFQRAA